VPTPKVGDSAPDFTTWSTRGGERVGDKFTLSDIYKKHTATVLAFFPLAFTGG
jgi:peroxiredoxin